MLQNRSINNIENIIFELKKNLNIIANRIEDLNYITDNYVCKEIKINGKWSIINNNSTISALGCINVRTLKNKVNIYGNIPRFVYTTEFNNIIFTTDENIPNESLTNLTNKTVLFDDESVGYFIVNINTDTNQLISIYKQIVKQGKPPPLFPPLNKKLYFKQLNFIYFTDDTI